MVNSMKDLGKGEREGDHDKQDESELILERFGINASTPSWRGWNLHLNDFGFLLKTMPFMVNRGITGNGLPNSSRGFKISNAESIDAAIIHIVERPM
jgi:hypothetical protein